MKLKIILQEKDMVVVHKPHGFLTYADSKDQWPYSAKEQLQRQLGKKLFPVHRIDKDTCGLLTFAFHPEKAKELTSLFRTRDVKKSYLAIVHDWTPDRGVVNEPLEKNKEKVKEAALTDFQTLAKAEVDLGGEKRKYSLVKLDPKTGRYHQIRRHLKFIGHPILGDPLYGNSWNNREFEEKFTLKRTLLSACELRIPDREKQKMLILRSKPDEDFQKIATFMGWTLP